MDRDKVMGIRIGREALFEFNCCVMQSEDE